MLSAHENVLGWEANRGFSPLHNPDTVGDEMTFPALGLPDTLGGSTGARSSRTRGATISARGNPAAVGIVVRHLDRRRITAGAVPAAPPIPRPQGGLGARPSLRARRECRVVEPEESTDTGASSGGEAHRRTVRRIAASERRLDMQSVRLHGREVRRDTPERRRFEPMRRSGETIRRDDGTNLRSDGTFKPMCETKSSYGRLGVDGDTPSVGSRW